MKALARELHLHARLIATCLALQSFTSMLPLVTVFKYSDRLSDSFAANVIENYSAFLILSWVWCVSIGLLGAGGYWSSEVGGRYFLEAWRHESFSGWLHRKLGALVVIVCLVCGFVPVAFFLGAYPDQPVLATLAGVLVCLYSLTLVAAFVSLSVAGLQSGHAYLVVLAFHIANIVLDHLGLPNIITWFLVGERGTLLTALVAGATLGPLLVVLPRLVHPNALASRGSEFV